MTKQELIRRTFQWYQINSVSELDLLVLLLSYAIHVLENPSKPLNYFARKIFFVHIKYRNHNFQSCLHLKNHATKNNQRSFINGMHSRKFIFFCIATNTVPFCMTWVFYCSDSHIIHKGTLQLCFGYLCLFYAK